MELLLLVFLATIIPILSLLVMLGVMPLVTTPSNALPAAALLVFYKSKTRCTTTHCLAVRVAAFFIAPGVMPLNMVLPGPLLLQHPGANELLPAVLSGRMSRMRTRILIQCSSMLTGLLAVAQMAVLVLQALNLAITAFLLSMGVMP